jgi:hypothetical protein
VLQFLKLALVTCIKKSEKEDSVFGRSVIGLFGKCKTRRFQGHLQTGKRRGGRHSNCLSRQQMCQIGHNAVRKALGNLGELWEMGQESEL